MKPFFLLLFMLYTTWLSSQDLVLFYEKRTKVFKTGSFIELQLPAPVSEDGNNDCVRSVLRGKLLRSEADKVILQVFQSSEPLMQGRIRTGDQIKHYLSDGAGQELSIPKEIILSVKHKGKHRIRENTTVETAGYVLATLGMAHLVSVPVAKALENENQTGSLALLGAGELLTGVLLAVLADQKEYVTAEGCPGKSEANVWTIR